MTGSPSADVQSHSVAGDTTGRRRSLADGLAGHSNSFGVLRLVLATAVIFSHAFPLGGWGEDPLLSLTKYQQNIGGVAVLGFFAISGYLIAKSGMSADGLQFLWRRVLRIFPAFYVVLIVAGFIVGPIAWLMLHRPLATYFTFDSQGPFAYLAHNFDLWMRQYGVHDVFVTTTPYGATAGPVFNGSLWTLSYEFGAYLIIFVLVITGILKRAPFMVVVLTGFYFVVQIVNEVTPGAGRLILPTLGDDYRVSLPLIFLFGSCLAVYAKRVPLDGRLAILSAVFAIFTLWQGGLTILGFPAIAYLILWLAARLPARLHWIGQKNDYSYGMYVYGFLVQQFTASFGWNHWGYVPWTLACVVLTAGCAWLSWHGIEKRALSLKDVGPGRGIQYWRERNDQAHARRRAPRHDPSVSGGVAVTDSGTD
jgi:peptidoglycan/LPS O-acetylase OafA/YrhL